MKIHAFLRASPWIFGACLVGSGAGCSAEEAGRPPSMSGGKSGMPSGGAAGTAQGGRGGSASGGTATGGSSFTGGGSSGGSVSGGAGGQLIGSTGGIATAGGTSTGGSAAGGSAAGGSAAGGAASGGVDSGTGGGCASGQTSCLGLCVDTQTSAENCGACGKACDVDRPCAGGTCQCPAGQTNCSGTCVDVQTDQANCGMCGTACMNGTPCTAGQCTQGGMCTADNMTYNGRITWYTLATEMVGCHYPTSSLPRYYGAMNTADYKAGGVCGACVEITNQQNGQKLTVLIADECPEATNQQWCFSGSHHIDLIQPAYQALNANNNPQISWRYVPCEPTGNGNISYYFDKAAKQGYLAVTPMNHRHRLTKVEVKDPSGAFLPLTRSYYDMWETTVQLGPGPYTFRATDIYGHVIEDASVALSPGQVVTGVGQFATCN